MQIRHVDRKQYFQEQEYTAKSYVIPFISSAMELGTKTSVLEIGCGEGGNLKPFLDMGCSRVVGVDLTKSKIDNAIKYYADHSHVNNIEFLLDDIYKVEDIGKFDLIIMRDVLEHIHDQERFMAYVKRFLKPEGLFYLGFPPWVNPFGGHQQMCKSKVLSKLPFFHILPFWLYRFILKLFGENETTISSLIEVKTTAISINRFEKILKLAGYKKEKRTFYFINPNYEVKFSIKPRKLNRILSGVPYLREFFITTNYYLLSIDTLNKK